MIHLQAQIGSLMKFYATFLSRLFILLDIINETSKSDTFPKSWREALIISIPKPRKAYLILLIIDLLLSHVVKL